jgi:hypothetical protein
MQNIADKVDNTPGASGELTAAEFNDHKNEQQEPVLSSGQTLSNLKTPDQLSRSMFIYGTSAQTMTDAAPSADVIELTPLTGSSGLITPDAYAQMEGLIVEFDKATANTSSTVTVNFGQTALTLLGAKSLKLSDGSNPAIGAVFGRIRIQFDVGNDYWIILSAGIAGRLTISSLSSDYVILDNDGIDYFDMNPSATMRTLTLPTLANNLGRTIRIKNNNNGMTRLLRAGSDVIDDGKNDVTEIIIHSRGDEITITGTSSKWVIDKLSDTIFLNFVNCNDWTNRSLGSVDIDVDGGSSPSLGYELGEIVDDGTVSGRVIKIVDNADGTGTITVYQTTAGGNFTNNATLTGQNSSATSSVNEPILGSTKNKDTVFYHGSGLDFQDYEYQEFFSTGGTYSTAFSPRNINQTSGDNRGFTFYQDDSNNFHVKVADAGWYYINSSGITTAVQSDNWYYDIKWKRVI